MTTFRYLLFICPLLCMYTACRMGERSTTGWGDPQPNVSPSEVACILTTRDPAAGLNATNLLWIRDTAFVRSLYGILRAARAQPVKPVTYMLPRPIIFTDANERVICAFLYEPIGVPANVFQPCEIRITHGNYELRRDLSDPGSLRTGIVVPGFDELAKDYLRIYPELGSQ